MNIFAKISGEVIGWLTARMPGLPSDRALSPNHAEVGDKGLPSWASYVGVIVLLYSPGLEYILPSNRKNTLSVKYRILVLSNTYYDIKQCFILKHKLNRLFYLSSTYVR